MNHVYTGHLYFYLNLVDSSIYSITFKTISSLQGKEVTCIPKGNPLAPCRLFLISFVKISLKPSSPTTSSPSFISLTGTFPEGQWRAFHGVVWHKRYPNFYISNLIRQKIRVLSLVQENQELSIRLFTDLQGTG